MSQKQQKFVTVTTHQTFTLIELLVVMLVLGILMAIAIPLIGGAREAANNTRCRSNLKQLHVAIIAYATIREQRVPKINGSDDLSFLATDGFLDQESKLGNCPGDDQPTLAGSSYEGGPSLDGGGLSKITLAHGDWILKDKDTEFHNSGSNRIYIDGSIKQE